MADTRQDAIKAIQPIADKVYLQTGVLPSVTIAQFLQETGGKLNNKLAQGFNFFGEKAGSGWTGKKILLQTKEDYGEGLVTVNDYFRIYDNPEQAAQGRIKLLQQDNFSSVGKAKDFETQAKLLKAGGYATDKTYAQSLIGLYKEENLSQYDVGIDTKQVSSPGLNQGEKLNIVDDAKKALSSGVLFTGRMIVYIGLSIILVVALFKAFGGSTPTISLPENTPNIEPTLTQASVREGE